MYMIRSWDQCCCTVMSMMIANEWWCLCVFLLADQMPSYKIGQDAYVGQDCMQPVIYFLEWHPIVWINTKQGIRFIHLCLYKVDIRNMGNKRIRRMMHEWAGKQVLSVGEHIYIR